MELRWENAETKEIGVAFVADNDAEVLEAMGYYHCDEEDFRDEYDGMYVEVWKPHNLQSH